MVLRQNRSRRDLRQPSARRDDRCMAGLPALRRLERLRRQRKEHLDKLLGRIIGEHITMRSVLTPGLWPVKMDPAQLEQVVVNLAVNARDAMPGGGRLTIQTANAVLDETYA